MGGQARLAEPGFAFHITARGNYRQTVFFTEADRAEEGAEEGARDRRIFNLRGLILVRY